MPTTQSMFLVSLRPPSSAKKENNVLTTLAVLFLERYLVRTRRSLHKVDKLTLSSLQHALHYLSLRIPCLGQDACDRRMEVPLPRRRRR